MTSYIALIRKDIASIYGVDFPDFPGCVTAGETLEDARRLAAEALELHVEEMLLNREPLPDATSLETIMEDGGNHEAVAFLVEISV